MGRGGMERRSIDVAIVGYGPVGATFANLLGQRLRSPESCVRRSTDRRPTGGTP